MKREIKFRVWDLQNSNWATNSVARESMGLEFGVNDYFDNIAGEKSIRFDFQQFTGLTDKNGKDIYEGDILKDKWNYINDTVIIKYKANGFVGENINKKSNFLDLENKNYLQFEIIGNIHENPELLK